MKFVFVKYVFATLLLLGCGPKPIEDEGISLSMSQARSPGETFSEAELNYKNSLDQIQLKSYVSTSSVINNAKPISEIENSDVAEFTSSLSLQDAFAYGRDLKFVESDSEEIPLRRSTWLYPDDGCFARADLLVRNLQASSHTNLSKVFIFGNLEVSTQNASGGRVFWWFHVVPLAKVDGVLYALDPAVDPKGPLLLEDWVKAITSDEDAKVAICSASAYSPYSRCSHSMNESVSRALDDQKLLLEKEWNRIKVLGRDPLSELGESPPWVSDD